MRLSHLIIYSVHWKQICMMPLFLKNKSYWINHIHISAIHLMMVRLCYEPNHANRVGVNQLFSTYIYVHISIRLEYNISISRIAAKICCRNIYLWGSRWKKIPQDSIILTRANVLPTLTKLHIFSQVWRKQFYGKILYRLLHIIFLSTTRFFFWKNLWSYFAKYFT